MKGATMQRTKPISISLPPDVKQAGTQAAKEDARSFSSYVLWLIQTDLKRRDSTKRAA